MAVERQRMKRLVGLLASLLVIGAIVVAVRATLKRDDGTAPEVQSEEVREAQTQEYLATLAVHRTTALAALRLLVPSSEVRDEDVTLIFWEPVTWDPPANAIDWDPHKAGFAGGYWLGKTRAVALIWESKANELVSLSSLWRPHPSAPVNREGQPAAPPFYDLRATDEASIRAFELMAQRARFGARPVVPISLGRIEGGLLKVEYLDGWDSGCGHWSSGWLRVNPHDGVVKMEGHVT
jgi:hypothetical protein